ncbi:MAG: hypothetical protein ABI318_18905 [Chthoniobacteraceae bacterium]
MIDFLHRIAGVLVGGLTRAASAMPPQLVLMLHALAIAALVVAVYGLVSNQPRILRRKNRMIARLLEIRMFQSDPLAVLGSFRRVLVEIVAYVAASARPLLILVPVMVLWIAQLAVWFEWRPLAPGESAVVSISLKSGISPVAQPASLETPDGIAVETPAFRSVATNEVSWRIRAIHAGRGELRCTAAAFTAQKDVVAGSALEKVSPKKVGGAFWSRVLWPAEKSLEKDAPFSEIRIAYPDRSLRFFGWKVNWLVALLIASFALALVVKRPFRVEF